MLYIASLHVWFDIHTYEHATLSYFILYKFKLGNNAVEAKKTFVVLQKVKAQWITLQ